MIQYKYAFNENDKWIDVKSINISERYNCKYYCVACKKELIPKLGKKNERHFAHKHDSDALTCSSETYLHNVSKTNLYNLLLQRIKEKGTFILKYKIKAVCERCHFPKHGLKNCEVGDTVETLDLLHYFNQVKLEKTIDSFRPDLSLYNEKNEKVFIEISVTHNVEEKKIKSKNKIIEIFINNEDQIKEFGDGIDQSKLKVVLHNFRPAKKRIEPNECKQKLSKFFAFKSGRFKIITGMTFFEYFENKKKYKHSLIYENDVSEEDFKQDSFLEYLKQTVIAHQNNIGIKSCNLCVHHTLRNNYYVYCRHFGKEITKITEAVECELFCIDNPKQLVLPDFKL